MSDDIVKSISALDFSGLSSEDAARVATVLLQKIPAITGLIQKVSQDREKKIQERFKQIKIKATNGTCKPEEIENLIGDLSNQYTYYLSQIGMLENQLTQAESMKAKISDKVYGVRIATLPIAMMLDFVNTLKECSWAKIVWDEKNGTKCEKICDYARLVDIYIEPNMRWQDKTTFTMLMGNYLLESEYTNLAQKLSKRLAPYHNQL